MAEFVNVLLFVVGASLAGAATLAAISALQPDRCRYGHRVMYFLWRFCLPALLFEELILRLFFGRFYP